jgi:hypothetical protein
MQELMMMAANKAFNSAVPSQLLDYLVKNKNNLLPEIKLIWETNGSKTSGNWEEVFGKSLATDEIFMAWYYAVFANELTKAGKAVYNLPMFVNAALNRPGRKPGISKCRSTPTCNGYMESSCTSN